MADPVGTWHESGEWFTAADGREFAIFSEQVRGEPRFWNAKEYAPAVGASPRTSEDWRNIPGDGSYGSRGKQTQQRRVERYVRETMA